MNNKRLGTEFEREFCELLAACGFWVHFMSPSASGAQPCDIIACKNDAPFLFDCKTCEKNVFHLSRLENNQILAFDRFLKTGNDFAFIAVKHDDKIYLIPYNLLQKKGSVRFNDLFEFEPKEWGFTK